MHIVICKLYIAFCVRHTEIKSNGRKKKKESVIKVPLWPQAVDKLWSVVVKQQLFRFKTKL